MPVKTYSIVATTTPEAAYAYVSDLSTHPAWSLDSMHIEPEQKGPVQVGSTYKAVGHLVGKPNSSTVEVTALSPGRSFTFIATDGNSKFQHEFVFTKDAQGARVDRNMTILKSPLFFKIIFPVLEPLVIRPGTMKCMNLLKNRLEEKTT